MADEPVIASAIDLTSQQLLCQLCEEVGLLRGALIALRYSVASDFTPSIDDAIQQHDKLSAIRRTFSVTKARASSCCDS